MIRYIHLTWSAGAFLQATAAHVRGDTESMVIWGIFSVWAFTRALDADARERARAARAKYLNGGE